MRHLRTFALALAAAIILAGCSASSHLGQVYLLTSYGVTVGVFTTHQGADEKEASFPPEQQKHMSVGVMEVSD